MNYGIFIGYHFTQAWLAMSLADREEFRRVHLDPIFVKYSDRIQAQHYDAEAFSANPTDFMFVQTDDLRAYYFFIEELRETPLFSEGLADIDVIHVGLADGYKDYAAEVHHDES